MTFGKEYLNFKFLYIQGYVTPNKIKEALLGLAENNKTIINYFNKLNEQYNSKIGIIVTKDTYFRYKLAQKRLREFLKQEYNIDDIPYREKTTIFLEIFYLFLRNNKSGNNNAMKTIRHLSYCIQLYKKYWRKFS